MNPPPNDIALRPGRGDIDGDSHPDLVDPAIEFPESSDLAIDGSDPNDPKPEDLPPPYEDDEEIEPDTPVEIPDENFPEFDLPPIREPNVNL